MGMHHHEGRKMIRTPSFLVQLFIFGVLLAALGVTLMPEFRGGIFVTAVVAITEILLGCVMIFDVWRPALPGKHAAGPGPSAGTGETLESVQRLQASQVGKVVCLSAVFFLPIVPLGVYFGAPVGIALILRHHCRTSRWFAVVFAVIAGSVLPWLFTVILSTALWPGVVPEIIPDWLGGGILPPI